jgi:helicase
VLLREGYEDKKCLEQLSVEELSKIVPKRLAGRIKKRCSAEICNPKPATCNSQLETCNLQPLLQIDQHRPDRIIFQGKEIKVTAKEFSLIHLLAQHPEQVMSYNELLDKLWKDEEDAIYNRVSFHISKVRRTILKIIGESKINKEKVKNIFTVVSKRGVMLKLKADQIKIN